ncbi:hypothetical protein M5689_020902 [Euphorbia peplus]|nr:hypothetical protein M5689_020902 [Euphorbia peplus]
MTMASSPTARGTILSKTAPVTAALLHRFIALKPPSRVPTRDPDQLGALVTLTIEGDFPSPTISYRRGSHSRSHHEYSSSSSDSRSTT